MLNLDLYTFIKWLHLVAFALGGGSAMLILVLVGFEDSRDDLKGMTSILWRRTAVWAFRLAVVLGLVLLALRFRDGDHPFDAYYLHWKLALVALLLLCSELSAKSLGRARRGAALLAFLLFLMTTFVAVNHDAFGVRKHPGGGPYSGSMTQGS